MGCWAVEDCGPMECGGRVSGAPALALIAPLLWTKSRPWKRRAKAGAPLTLPPHSIDFARRGGRLGFDTRLNTTDRGFGLLLRPSIEADEDALHHQFLAR